MYVCMRNDDYDDDDLSRCHTYVVCCRMLEEILASRFMIKKSMKDYKDNPVCILFTRVLNRSIMGCFYNN